MPNCKHTHMNSSYRWTGAFLFRFRHIFLVSCEDFCLRIVFVFFSCTFWLSRCELGCHYQCSQLLGRTNLWCDIAVCWMGSRTRDWEFLTFCCKICKKNCEFCQIFCNHKNYKRLFTFLLLVIIKIFSISKFQLKAVSALNYITLVLFALFYIIVHIIVKLCAKFRTIKEQGLMWILSEFYL